MLQDTISDRSREIPGNILQVFEKVIRIDLNVDSALIYDGDEKHEVKFDAVRVYGFDKNVEVGHVIRTIVPIVTEFGLEHLPGQYHYIRAEIISYNYDDINYHILDIKDPCESKIAYEGKNTIDIKRIGELNEIGVGGSKIGV